MADRVTISDARATFGLILAAAEHAGKRTVITRHGRDVAAIVPIEEFQVIEKSIIPLNAHRRS